MNTTTLAQLETRLHRVERQNGMLLALLYATVSLALLGATKSGGNVITADEVRTYRLRSIFGDRMNTKTPNQSLQPTATRSAFAFFMIKTVPEIFSRTPGSRGQA